MFSQHQLIPLKDLVTLEPKIVKIGQEMADLRVNFVLKMGKFGKNFKSIFQQHFSFDFSTAINYLLRADKFRAQDC